MILEGTFTDEYAAGGGVEVGLDPAAYDSLGTFDPASNVTIDTTALTMSGGASFTGIAVAGVPDTDGIAVFTFDSIEVDAGITITATGSRPLALLSQTDVTIAGVINVSATYDRPGPGGGAGGIDLQEDGQPAAGALASGAGQGGTGGLSSSYGSGGGGGAFGGDGGIGSANAYSQGAGPGGAAYGDLETSLLAGSGGGASSGSRVGTLPEQAGHGGNGGGAIEIGATGSLGLVAGGKVLASGSSGTSYYYGGGGGGAGGGILLHATNVNWAGILDADGGDGGTALRGGGGGGGGRILIAYNTSGTYVETGTHSEAGGMLGGGTAAVGDDGTFDVIAVEGGGPAVETFTYSIDWGDGTTPDTGDATIVTPGSPGMPTEAAFGGSHTYGDNGLFTVTVIVDDGAGGSDTAYTTVTVENVVPTIDPLSSYVGDEGSPVDLSARATDPGSDDLTFTWNWGDGTSDTVVTYYNDGVGADPLPSPEINPMDVTDAVGHTYGDNGVYTVTLTVEDDDGGWAEAITTVTVSNLPPVATDDTATTEEDQAVVIDVLGNDTDPAGVNDPLTIIELDGTAVSVGGSVVLGSGATVTLNAGGTVTYLPALGFTGPDDFGYTIDDGDLGTATATVDVAVTNLVDVSGRVFDDLDNDGVYEPGDGDVGIADVAIEVWDQAMTTLLDSTTTAADGSYSLDVNLGAGAYVIVEAVDELAELGLLDGKETAGNLGGAVDNTQDCNQIEISVSDPASTADAVDYLFAEIRSSDVFGRVWRDFNDDGEINFDEEDVNDVVVELTGTDDRGNSVSLTGITADNLGFAFTNLRPGTYAITETQPVDLDDGQEVLGDVTDLGVPTAVAAPGMIDGNDRFSGIELVPGTLADRYNFGELPQAGEEMPCGSTASIGFWHNRRGQALIKQLSDYAAAHGGSATQLGDWLAATFPDMYGPGAEYDAARRWDWDMNLAGKSDCYVAWTFRYLHRRNRRTMVENGGVPKVDAQIMALALATFATSENLAGTIAQCYWFNTSEDGIAYTAYNVLDVLTVEEAADLGLSQANGNMDADGNVTIIDILHSTNDMATLGLLYDSDDTAEGDGDGEIDDYEEQLRKLANRLYRMINGRRWWW